MSPDHDQDPHIRTDIEPLGNKGHLARVTVDNRTRLNVLNTALIIELTAAIRTLALDRQLRCVILMGAGERAFIGGADIREMVELDTATAYPFISKLHLACAAIRQLPVPVIARIQGYCLGAGLEVAASCDLRVASDDATFGMPEVKVGIPSVIEAALLPRLIGLGKAREMVYTGQSLSAADAGQCGLVDKVVPLANLDAAAQTWVDAICAAGARAIRLQKTLLRRWDTEPLDHAIQTGMRYFAGAYETDEPRRLMQAFLDRKRD
ncbi:MAG: enoyl-CoA hydratase [Acidobacteria bacterium]|jgi:enoyl-CoA hydratase/carnithine racemase|nr:enoyl-CoA hydratase [Acidobacteriota bacterium]MDP7338826.1 enoyl-CoA hydratase [Vicinamibacterales bacterium]MDP7480057.1 enoyl-CoA hydratase [Vicinamibacterales bacterium]MDP7691155.1 enoyl-CoA hydratase [Vicinamibacterales bacterium]HJN45459.1 enoyl-CoA hydratase [Vicinamibacterales bacterium]|tara:strand:+ start:261 stop:1055 length:795 start_codon:yes stop_codon:yes gene_type:complete